MREYAARRFQKGMPRLAKEFLPAVIDQAAMPIRGEKWLVEEKNRYRVTGVAWGGTPPGKVFGIRFKPEEDYVRGDKFKQCREYPWTFLDPHLSPKAPGTYTNRLASK